MRTKTIIMTICGLLVSTCLAGTGVGLFLRNKKGRKLDLSPQLISNKISQSVSTNQPSPVDSEDVVSVITNEQNIISADIKKSDSFSKERNSANQNVLSGSRSDTPVSLSVACSNGNISSESLEITAKKQQSMNCEQRSSFSNKNMEDVYTASYCYAFFV